MLVIHYYLLRFKKNTPLIVSLITNIIYETFQSRLISKLSLLEIFQNFILKIQNKQYISNLFLRVGSLLYGQYYIAFYGLYNALVLLKSEQHLKTKKTML